MTSVEHLEGGSPLTAHAPASAVEALEYRTAWWVFGTALVWPIALLLILVRVLSAPAAEWMPWALVGIGIGAFLAMRVMRRHLEAGDVVQLDLRPARGVDRVTWLGQILAPVAITVAQLAWGSPEPANMDTGLGLLVVIFVSGVTAAVGSLLVATVQQQRTRGRALVITSGPRGRRGRLVLLPR